jgi:hypothetical protein
MVVMLKRKMCSSDRSGKIKTPLWEVNAYIKLANYLEFIYLSAERSCRLFTLGKQGQSVQDAGFLELGQSPIKRIGDG